MNSVPVLQSSGGDAGTGFVILLMLGGAYFTPLIVAGMRNHHNIGAIAVVNIFTGWTFIGWIVALAMAAGHVKPKEASSPRMAELGTGRVYDDVTAPPVASGAAFCTSCGTPFGEGARFCSKCGSPVAS